MRRFGRDNARNSLFAGYDAARTNSESPGNKGYGYSPAASRPGSNPAFSAYPGSGSANPYAGGAPDGAASKFRSATPNQRGQYSDAVLNELESQNDSEMEGMSAKVQMLKNVRIFCGQSPFDAPADSDPVDNSHWGRDPRLDCARRKDE